MAENQEDAVEAAGQGFLQLLTRAPEAAKRLALSSVSAITPDVPAERWWGSICPTFRRWHWKTFLASIVFCLGAAVLFSGLSGRLLPDSDPQTINLLEDRANLFLYAVVCPAYVTCDLWMLWTAAHYWSRKAGHDRAEIPEIPGFANRRYIATFIIGAVSILFTGTYIFSIVNSDNLQYVYWFMEQIRDVRRLNQAGYFYVIINFCLLFLTVTAVLIYLSLVAEGVKTARVLRPDDCVDEQYIVEKLQGFFFAYTIGLYLIALYALNTMIWFRTPLGCLGGSIEDCNDNYLLTVISIFLFGIAGTWLPRIYVNRKLVRLGKDCLHRGLVDPSEQKYLPRGMNMAADVAFLALTGFGLTGMITAMLGFDPLGTVLDVFKVGW